MRTEKTIRDYAREAKKRMKTGFWQEQRGLMEESLERAGKDGISQSRVVAYFNKKIERLVHNYSEEDEVFYIKVKKILDEEGEIAGVIGRLTDNERFKSLSYEQKQRYTLEISEKYRLALERYYEEKEFEAE